MPFLSKYGVARHIYIPMVKRAVVDHAVSADWTPAAGDVKISKDGGAAANVTNLPVAIAMGNSTIWDFSLTATEMQAAQVVVTIADTATKAVEDSAFVIETHGNASGQFQVDFADSVRAGLTALPNAAAEAAGGLYTRGTGAGQIRQDANGRIDANAKAWIDGTIPAVNVTGVPLVDDKYLLGTIYATPNTAGLMDVNAKQAGGTAWGSGAVTAASIAAAALNGKGDWNIGKTGYALSAAGVQAIWDALTSALTTVGSIGKLLVDNVTASISAVKTQTDKLTFTVANQIDANVLDWKSATAPAMTGDAYARLGAPAGASVSADIAAVKTDTAAVKVQTDKLTFTVANQVDSNVLDWKSSTAPAMTGDAYARLGAPAGASVSADIAAVKAVDDAVKAKTDNLPASPAAVGSAMTLTSGERDSVADALLNRDMSTGTDSGSTTVRTVRQALRFLRNKFSISGGTLTILKEDDSTPSWSATVTTTSGANPVTGIDPA
jgi:hypothetical protein